MIIDVITFILAVTVTFGFWLLIWDVNLTIRYATEEIRYRARLLARQPYPSKADYQECMAEAMYLTFHRANAERLLAMVDEDRFLRDSERAQGLVELALAPGLRVVT